MFRQRRFKHQLTLQDRLGAWAMKIREQAELLKPSPEKDALLKKAMQAENASHADGWVNSPGLRPPK